MVVYALEVGPLGELITGLATALLAITAIATVLFTKGDFRAQAQEKRKEAKERRGRWLTDLHTRFTTEASFQSIRRQLYNREQSELIKALAHKRKWENQESDQPLSSEEQRLVVEFDDYLDFFALIWHLIENGQLDAYDAYILFSWYVLDPFEAEEVMSEITVSYPSVVKLRVKFEAILEERRSG